MLPPRRISRRGGSMAADRKSTRLNSSHGYISYAVFCLKKNDDVGVVTQAVIELRAVSLRVDRLQLDALDVSVFFRSFLRRMNIQTSLPLPDPGERCEGPQVSQGVGIGFGFGEDVLRKRLHAVFLVGPWSCPGLVKSELHSGWSLYHPGGGW